MAQRFQSLTKSICRLADSAALREQNIWSVNLIERNTCPHFSVKVVQWFSTDTSKG